MFSMRFYEPANLEAVVEFVETRYLWREASTISVIRRRGIQTAHRAFATAVNDTNYSKILI